MKLPHIFRRKIGRLVRKGRIPAQTYRVMLFDRESGVIFLNSKNATVVAYCGRSRA
jgi:hypothetical protein